METGIATIYHKSFLNRGFVSGPFCYAYGVAGIIMTLFLQDLRDNPLFLFAGCAIIGTVTEWITAKILERIHQQKWWDYSEKRFNIDGYVCLRYTLIWGALGCLVVLWANDFVLGFFRMLPAPVRQIIAWSLAAVGLVDLIGSLLIMNHLEHRNESLLHWNRWLNSRTHRLGEKISDAIERRIEKGYPNILKPRPDQALAENEDFRFPQMFWLVLLTAIVGDVIETIFCRVTMGRWMSRSSLVIGPFSIVWGCCLLLGSILLRKDRQKSDAYLFCMGTIIGGTFEYICSVFTQIVFGKVFWDYTAFPFNLGGRVNLLFCFFWGIAAVIWIRYLYPLVMRPIQWLLSHTGQWLTVLCALLFTADIVLSCMALVRYDARAKEIPPANTLDETLDEWFPDEKMREIYPKAKPEMGKKIVEEA